MFTMEQIRKAYIISDTHFGHLKCLNKERSEKFKTIEEHDEYIIEAINKIVKPDDLLFHLGDTGDLEKVKQLNGIKILVKGNHDKQASKLYNSVFKEVYNYPIFISKRILLSHLPEAVSPHVLNIHGHLHGSYLDSKNHINASIHVIDYKPIFMRNVFSYIDKNLEPQQVKFLTEWYADKQVFLNKEREDLVLDENGKIKLKETIELNKDLKGREECNYGKHE